MNGTQQIPPGVDFIWDQAERRLGAQLEQADALDRKTGILLTLNGVAAGLLAAVSDRLSGVGRVFGAIVIAGLFLGASFALASFRTVRYVRSPRPEEMWHFGAWSDSEIKLRYLSTRFEALDENERRLRRKGIHVTASTLILAGVAFVVTVSTFLEMLR